MRILILIFFMFLLGNWGFPRTAYSTTVESISISYHGFGWHDHRCEYQIVRTENDYKGELAIIDPSENTKTLVNKGVLKENYQTITDDEQIKFIFNNKQIHEDFQIEQGKIDRLLNTLNSNPIGWAEAEQFELSETFLSPIAKAVIEDIFKDFSLEEYPDLTIRKQELLKIFQDPERTRKKIQRYNSIRWSDDHVDIKVFILMDDATKISLTSEEQIAYAIPWKVEKNDKQYETYDIRISQALGALMTPKCTYFDRVGKELKKFFKENIWEDSIEKSTKALIDVKRWRDQLSPITQHYYIYGSYFFGRGKHGGESRHIEHILDNFWSAKLRKLNWPSNLFVNYTVAIRNGRPDVVGFSQNQVEKYIEHILSINWLKQFIKNHPYHEFVINYESRLSIKAKNYQDSLKILNKYLDENMSPVTQPFSKGIIHMQVNNDVVGESTWFIYLDKTMVLRSSLNSNENLKWNSSDLNNGMRISAQGEIIDSLTPN